MLRLRCPRVACRLESFDLTCASFLPRAENLQKLKELEYINLALNNVKKARMQPVTMPFRPARPNPQQASVNNERGCV